jgi:P27 family predicted phage terminase small subunit
MSKRGPKPRLKTIVPLRQSWGPPSHLTAAAKEEFERVVDLLRQRGALDQTDRELVVRRAELVDIAREAYKRRLKDGDYAASDRGNLAPHPAIRAHISACGAIRLIDVELGLTPARTRKAGASTVDQTGYGQWSKHLGGGES